MANQYQFLAGPGRALLFSGQTLIGVGKTFSETTFDASITGEEVRGGSGNLLFGKYFHDSNLNVTITDPMFNLEYVASALGVNVEAGGLSLYESTAAGESITTAGSITLANTPVAFDGALIGWYKKPSDKNWTIATIAGNVMTIPNSQIGEVYCIKYFYQNVNARSITIKAQYVPRVLHLVLINDLYSGNAGDVGNAERYGRLITDIPQFQLDGSQNLSLTATTTANVSLTGSALAVDTSDSCEEDLIYGTMTEEIFGSVWQDSVNSLAIENSEIDLAQSGTATLIVRAVFNDGRIPARMDNSAFTFAIETAPTATATDTEVDATGKITAGSVAGFAIISVSLTDYENVPPAYAYVTVT